MHGVVTLQKVMLLLQTLEPGLQVRDLRMPLFLSLIRSKRTMKKLSNEQLSSFCQGVACAQMAMLRKDYPSWVREIHVWEASHPYMGCA